MPVQVFITYILFFNPRIDHFNTQTGQIIFFIFGFIVKRGAKERAPCLVDVVDLHLSDTRTPLTWFIVPPPDLSLS